MLTFLRKKAQVIVITIVVGFVGTMFTGMFFLKGMGDDNQLSEQDISQAIAISGEIILTRPLYYNQLQEDFGQLIQRGIPLNEVDPEVIELMKWQSFSKAMDYTTLLKIAKDKKIKATKGDVKYILLDVYKQYDLKNKKELKAYIRTKGLDYNQFIKNIKNNIIVQKLMQDTVKDIVVSERDIQNRYTELQVSHILMTGESGEGKSLSVSQKIQEGLSFETAVEMYSEDPLSKDKKGDIGWVRMENLAPEIEKAIYSLKINEISKPIKGPQGVHIFKVSQKRGLKKPKNFNLENERKSLLSIRQKKRLQAVMEPYRGGQELRVQDPELLAVYAKTKQDYDLAKGAYYGMISKSPSSPIPHYLLGKLLLANADLKEAKKELEKAEILSDVDTTGDYVYINMAMADLYKQKKWHKSKRRQYDKAIKKAKDNLYANYYLKERLSVLNEPERLARVNREIKTLEAEIQAKIDEQKTAQKALENQKILANGLEEK